MESLIRTKLLYQKVEVSLAGLPAELKNKSISFDAEHIAMLEKEATLRPWHLTTHHLGDDEMTRDVTKGARVGASPVGTPPEKMPLYFYSPAVHLFCKRCKNETTFVALSCSDRFWFGSPLPRTSDRGTEQIFCIFYRCEACRHTLHVVLVRRMGMHLHLCGFAPRKEQKPLRKVPKEIAPILQDAVNAVSEGDLFAGFYHLRTMVEHYMKFSLSIASDFRIRGEDLLAQYNATLPQALRGSLPSLTEAFDTLSKFLHSRTGSTEDFNKLLHSVCDHIEAKLLLQKYTGA